MKHTKRSTEERRATAFHEAGHAVAAVALGWSIEYVHIKPDKRRAYAGTTVLRQRSCPLIQLYEHLQILTAGAICQGKACPVPLESLTMGAWFDLEQMEKVSIRILRKLGQRDANWTPGVEAQEDLIARTTGKTRDLIDIPSVWAAVTAVAEGLLKRGRLQGDEVSRIYLAAQ